MDQVSDPVRPVDAPVSRSDRPAIPDIVTRTLAGVLVALRAVDRHTVMAVGAAIAALSALAAVLRSDADLRSVPRAVVATLAGAILALAGVAFVGATAPRVTWFGDLTSHGPR